MHDIECIVLGSGTSAGVPAIGCHCDVCCSDDPRDLRTRTSAAIRFVDDKGHPRMILIDTSPDLRQQVLREDRCDGIVFTHHHVDHLFGLDEVRRFNAVMQAPIDVYAEERTLENIRRVYPHIFEAEKNINPSFVARLVPRTLTCERPVILHGLRITPLRFLHGRLPILGYRFDAEQPGEDDGPLPLAWCTDVSGIPPETWPKLNGLKTLFLDMLRHRTHQTHMNLEQALAATEQIGAEQTWFIHMAHEISHAAVDADLPPGVGLAWDGLRT
jgi:phosphoribosyl 1,2-cyclic phosphate phosphodiesterase